MLLIRQALDLFSRDEKWKLVLLTVSMILAAVIEMAGVGLIMPFIAILERPGIIQEYPILERAYILSGAASHQSFLMIASVSLIVFFLAKNLLLGAMLYWQSAFLARSEAHVAMKLLERYLAMPYLRYTQRNTAELINNISIETSMLFEGLIKPFFFIVSDVFVTIAIIALLIAIAPMATFCAVGVIIGSVVVFYLLLRKPLKALGASRQYHRQQMIQWVNQSLGSMKEITVLGRTQFFKDSFRQHADGMMKTQTFSETVAKLPRIVIESFGVIIMIVIMMVLIGGTSHFIPTLSLFAMAAFRLMPSINRAAICATKVRYYAKTLHSLYADLVTDIAPEPVATTPIRFTRELVLRDVSFAYPGCNKNVLDGLDLTIAKGSSIGIIGPSGEGKSTLVDILLGLLPPSNGSITVDGVDIRENLADWHRHISYMPQTVYLTDDSIRRNVALGIADKDIDDDRIWAALKKAQLDGFVASLPEGLNAPVGEQGTRLSGGQRQRIGIARALYNKPDVLILDEATTALDPETEAKICQTLQSIAHDITIIAISHQPALIAITQKVYVIKGGKVRLRE